MELSEAADALRELEAARARSTNLWKDAARRLVRDRLAVVGGVVIVLIGLVAIFAPWIAPYPYDKAMFEYAYQFPNLAFPFGTDPLGRDMLSRIIWGARVSISVGFVTQIIALAIGVPIGSISGFLGGRVDTVIMRFVDVMYAFPSLLFVILLMSLLGGGLLNIFIAMGLVNWVSVARMTRGQILSLRERDFVKASIAAGAGRRQIITEHLLPNSLTPLIVQMTFGVPMAIFTEASLSFLGVGIRPPTPSWGQMVGEYQMYIQSFWHLSVFPGVAIALVMLSFTFFGDGLRDALDPRMKE